MRNLIKQLSVWFTGLGAIYIALCLLISLLSLTNETSVTPWEAIVLGGPYLIWACVAIILFVTSMIFEENR